MVKIKNKREIKTKPRSLKSEKGFMEEGEEVLTEEEEKQLKEKLKYYGYI